MTNEDWEKLMSALQGLGLQKIVIDRSRGFIGGYIPPTRE